MSAVTPNATTVAAGKALSVANTAKNQGLLAAGSFAVAYHLSTNTIYGDADDVVVSTTRTVSSLAAGASSAATTSLIIPAATPAGTYYVCANADSANAVIESSEVNNTLCSTTTVTVLKPDLIMSALSTTATSVNRGSTFRVANTAKNQGSAAAGEFAIKLVLSTNAIIGDADDIVLTPQRSLSSLAVGASRPATTTVAVPSAAPTGVYYVGAIADVNGAVSESDEANNTRLTTTTITVK
jgi:subtilase family serine protease